MADEQANKSSPSQVEAVEQRKPSPPPRIDPPTSTTAPVDTTSPTTVEPPLIAEAVEDNSEDNDSAIGDDNASSTASMASSIMAYRLENGRTYHAFKEDIGYVLPNDAPEQDRLDLQHHLFNLTFGGKLHYCPIGRDRPFGRVLDAGTGTGVWAMDFADDHPEAEVTGIDISPIQPSFVPPNLSFQVDDLEDEWTFSRPFDFVYARMMTGSISDWPRFIQQAHDNLSPGGWMEMHDISFPCKCDDGTLKPDSFLAQWSDRMLDATRVFGRAADGATMYRQQMIDAGFINTQELIFKWPMNRWPADPHYKELGFWTHQNISGGLSGLSMALFTRALGWSPEEVEVFLAKARDDMKDRSIHAWWTIHVVFGQRAEH